MGTRKEGVQTFRQISRRSFSLSFPRVSGRKRAWNFSEYRLMEGGKESFDPIMEQEFSSNREIRVSRIDPSSCILLEIGPSVLHFTGKNPMTWSFWRFFFFLFFFRFEPLATDVAKGFEYTQCFVEIYNLKDIKKKKKRERRKKEKRIIIIHRYTWPNLTTAILV